MNEATLCFDALIENEPFARCVVAGFVANVNPTLNEMVEIKTIISEAVANAIIHGYDGMNRGKVVLYLKLEGHTLTMKITDHGCGIEDIEKAREPLYTTKRHLERSGMGMTIMESLSDEFEIESKLQEGTSVTIVKRLKDHSLDEQDC